MQTRRLFAVLAAAGVGLTVALSGGNAQQPPEPINPPPTATDPAQAPATPQGVEVMTRGPVHEAFAEPVVRAPRATPVVATPPPAPIEELPPDQKPADPSAVWIPGYWAWDNDSTNYIWVSGVWRVPPPGMQWTPGYWAQATGGSQWVPGFWSSTEQAQATVLPEPPDPVNEAAPPQPDDTSTYVPGCWVWQTTRYLWRPGFWMAFRPGWTWVSARYVWTPAGYIFVDGHWDYGLNDRGLLFAPVAFTANVWTTPNWYYQPSYVVSDQFLLGALFVRADLNSYYFGDYFGPAYAQAGFVPWVDYRIGRVGYDPLFSYYRWRHRDDRRWLTDLQQGYVARASGQAPRPPHTLRQQLALTTELRSRPGNQGAAVASLAAVTPLASFRGQRLEHVPPQQLRQLQQHAVQLRTYSQQRQQIEVQLRQRGTVATAAGRPVTVNLPRTAIVHHTLQGAGAPPTAPSAPRFDTTIRQPAPVTPEQRTVPGRGAEMAPREERGLQHAPTPTPVEPRQMDRQPIPEPRQPPRTPPSPQQGNPPKPMDKRVPEKPADRKPPEKPGDRKPPEKPADRKPPEKPGDRKPPENPGDRKPPR